MIARPRPLVLVVVAASLAWGAAPAQVLTPFEDVPPCHYAAAAVARTAALDLFVGFPADDVVTIPNAVRQVFEGLRCADAGWSLMFLRDAPVRFGLLPRVALVGFDLASTPVQRIDDVAVLHVALTVVLEHDGERTVVERAGTVRVERGEVDGWRVPYADLAALDLPVFPVTN